MSEQGIEFKAIHQMQYVELITKLTSIAQRLNEIESIIGGTKRKWRDDTDRRLDILERNFLTSINKQETEHEKYIRLQNEGMLNYPQFMIKPDPIKEVYEKWKKNTLGLDNFKDYWKESWEAIKHHCEYKPCL